MCRGSHFAFLFSRIMFSILFYLFHFILISRSHRPMLICVSLPSRLGGRDECVQGSAPCMCIPVCASCVCIQMCAPCMCIPVCAPWVCIQVCACPHIELTSNRTGTPKLNQRKQGLQRTNTLPPSFLRWLPALTSGRLCSYGVTLHLGV